jgi:hypothetical protein
MNDVDKLVMLPFVTVKLVDDKFVIDAFDYTKYIS